MLFDLDQRVQVKPSLAQEFSSYLKCAICYCGLQLVWLEAGYVGWRCWRIFYIKINAKLGLILIVERAQKVYLLLMMKLKRLLRKRRNVSIHALMSVVKVFPGKPYLKNIEGTVA